MEKVYESALSNELMDIGFTVEWQKAIEVYYVNKRVGEYYADLVVNDVVIVEVRVQECLLTEQENQLIN